MTNTAGSLRHHERNKKRERDARETERYQIWRSASAELPHVSSRNPS